MASPLSQFLTPVGQTYAASPASFGQGYTPFGSVGGAAQQAPYDTAPKGSVTDGQAWNPTSQSLANQIGMWQQQQALTAQQQSQQMSAGNMVGGGNIASLGGDWAGVDQWNAQIQAAASKYGVPANLIKSIMKLESGGANLAANGAGAVGPMQVVQSIWGGLGYDLSDPAQNIMAGAAILKQNYDQYSGWAQQNGVDPWKAATYSYYAGNPYNLNAADDPAQGGSGMSTGAYGDQIWTNYQQLNSMGGTPYGGGSSGGFGGSSTGVTALVGSSSLEGWGEFGGESGNGLYGYGTAYGMSGSQHTGLDIAAPVGAPEYAPMGGTVTCAGTGIGSGADGGGCAAFNYVPNFEGALQAGQGNGRIEVLLDNGVVLIYGHSLSAAVQPGQRVNAGTLLGQSGGMNSPHTHLEARVRDPSMPSGWRIVDPRTVLGNVTVSPGGGSAPQQSIGNNGGYWAQYISHFS